MFIINQDLTISPSYSQQMVWGVKDDDLVLVKKDSQFKLIFDAIESSTSAGQVSAND
jgi:hypothetical protein